MRNSSLYYEGKLTVYSQKDFDDWISRAEELALSENDPEDLDRIGDGSGKNKKNWRYKIWLFMNNIYMQNQRLSLASMFFLLITR